MRVVLFFCLFIFLFFSKSQATTVAGRVVSNQNKNMGIAGIEIKVIDEALNPITTMTNAEGFWEVVVQAGQLSVEVVVPPGYAATSSPNPQDVMVPDVAYIVDIQPDGFCLLRIETNPNEITSGDIYALIIGGVLFIILLLSCFACFCFHMKQIHQIRL